MQDKIKQLFQKYRELIMYIIIGVMTTGLYYVTRFYSIKLGASSQIAVVIAQIVAILFAFVTNKTIVFRSKAETKSELAKQMVSFFSARGVSFLIDFVITYIFVTKYGYYFIDVLSLESIDYSKSIFSMNIIKGFIGSPKLLNEFIFTTISQIIILVSNYVFSKLVVFRKKKNAD